MELDTMSVARDVYRYHALPQAVVPQTEKPPATVPALHQRHNISQEQKRLSQLSLYCHVSMSIIRHT